MRDSGRQGGAHAEPSGLERAAGAVLRAVYVAAGAAVGAAAAVGSVFAMGSARARLRERRGVWAWPSEAVKPWIWIQAASVGEAEIAIALAHAMASRLPGTSFVISSMTATGVARVKREAGVESRYFPIDFARFVKRVVEPCPPLLFVAVETEIWPETLRLLQRRNVPTAVVNARLSDRSLPRYRRLGAMLSPLLAGLATVCARDEEAARRWRSLGAAEAVTVVTGNIKFDLATPRTDKEIPALFERGTGAPLLLAASTHEGEEELALDAFVAVRASHPDARLLLAPRHPRRAGAAFGLARSRWLAAVAWTDVVGIVKASKAPGSDTDAATTVWPPRVDVIVLDRLGLLRSAYAASDACFVGGSARPGPGGHNLLEAAAAGCPVAAGPLLGNVVDQVQVLEEARGLRLVENSAELSKFWLEAIETPELLNDRVIAARSAVAARRGALDRSVAALLALLAPIDGQT